MSKLFKLKEWLTVPEAAKHLSLAFNEEITEADVLRLALDEHIKMSIRFIDSMFAWPITPVTGNDIEFIKTQTLDANKQEHYCLLKNDRLIQSEKGWFQYPGEIIMLYDKLWDVILADDFRIYVEHLYQMREAGCFDPMESFYGDLMVENSKGEMFKLQWPSGNILGLNLPKDSEFVFRTGMLMEFEQQFVVDSTVINAPSETTGRREEQYEMILAVIAAFNFGPLQIPDGGKAKIKKTCLTCPRLFTDASFEHAWKAGLKAGYFRLANHEKFSPSK